MVSKCRVKLSEVWGLTSGHGQPPLEMCQNWIYCIILYWLYRVFHPDRMIMEVSLICRLKIYSADGIVEPPHHPDLFFGGI